MAYKSGLLLTTYSTNWDDPPSSDFKNLWDFQKRVKMKKVQNLQNLQVVSRNGEILGAFLIHLLPAGHPRYPTGVPDIRAGKKVALESWSFW